MPYEWDPARMCVSPCHLILMLSKNSSASACVQLSQTTSANHTRLPCIARRKYTELTSPESSSTFFPEPSLAYRPPRVESVFGWPSVTACASTLSIPASKLAFVSAFASPRFECERLKRAIEPASAVPSVEPSLLVNAEHRLRSDVSPLVCSHVTSAPAGNVAEKTGVL